MENPGLNRHEQEGEFTVTDPKGEVRRYKSIKEMIDELQSEQGEQK